MSEKSERLHEMTKESLELFSRMQALKEKEGDEMSEKRLELAEEMFALIARLVECPEHGTLDPNELDVHISTEEGTYSFTVDGLCCEKAREPVQQKLVTFLEKA